MCLYLFCDNPNDTLNVSKYKFESEIYISTADAVTKDSSVTFTEDYGFYGTGYNAGKFPGRYFIGEKATVTYKHATALEALIGYLKLEGREDIIESSLLLNSFSRFCIMEGLLPIFLSVSSSKEEAEDSLHREQQELCKKDSPSEILSFEEAKKRKPNLF